MIVMLGTPFIKLLDFNLWELNFIRLNVAAAEEGFTHLRLLEKMPVEVTLWLTSELLDYLEAMTPREWSWMISVFCPRLGKSVLRGNIDFGCESYRCMR